MGLFTNYITLGQNSHVFKALCSLLIRGLVHKFLLNHVLCVYIFLLLAALVQGQDSCCYVHNGATWASWEGETRTNITNLFDIMQATCVHKITTAYNASAYIKMHKTWPSFFLLLILVIFSCFLCLCVLHLYFAFIIGYLETITPLQVLKNFKFKLIFSSEPNVTSNSLPHVAFNV